jgi:hypothetical protein
LSAGPAHAERDARAERKTCIAIPARVEGAPRLRWRGLAAREEEHDAGREQCAPAANVIVDHVPSLSMRECSVTASA